MYRKIMYTNQNGESIVFGPCGPYRLRGIDTSGLGAEFDTIRALGVHGASTGDTLYQQRTIPCKLAVLGKDKNGRHSMAHLRQHWMQILRVMAPHVPGTLRLWSEAGGVYKIDCRPTEIPSPARKLGAWYNFNVDFVADDPFWMDEMAIEAELSTGSITIINDQPVDMPLIARVTGPTDSLRIESGGQKLFINQSIPAGQTLIVDTHRQKVTLDGVNASHKLSIDSTYLRLPTGENTVEVTCDQPVELEFIRLYVGV